MYNSLNYQHIEIEKCRIFYRSAGNPDHDVLLLLHGFPTSSHMFRELIPLLAENYYVIAPDYPGFGQSDCPSHTTFKYSFDHLSKMIDAFTEALKLNRYSLYLFDYGAPIGFRLALWHPERIECIVTQNGNIYEEGLGKKWEARKAYWQHPTLKLRKAYCKAFAPETIIDQYTFGCKENKVSPDGYTLDIAYMSRAGEDEIQSDLIYDYCTNVALYPNFQEYVRNYLPPILAVWGKNDPSFIAAGAEAFLKDQPQAEVHLLDSGHFALETECEEIAKLMLDFLRRNITPKT